MITVVFSSQVEASRTQVWSGVTTFAGVNQEFYPILRMTCPDPSMRLTPNLVSEKPLFRSWLLLFGIFPIDYDLLCITKVVQNQCFEEKSSMGLMSEWNHHRHLCDATQENVSSQGSDKRRSNKWKKMLSCEGTVVTDRLSFRPRIPGTGWLLTWIVKLLFWYRHRRLRELYSKCSS
jgi:hypothetical protein